MFPPSPPVERDIPPPAALVQFIYSYIGIIPIYVSLLPPCGMGHPSFSCGPGSVVLLHPFSSLKALYN